MPSNVSIPKEFNKTKLTAKNDEETTHVIFKPIYKRDKKRRSKERGEGVWAGRNSQIASLKFARGES